MIASDRQLRLSICIATMNRAAFIGETLDSILPQLRVDVELVIVDGASSDDTEGVVTRYASVEPSLRYVRLPRASGVDQDYDLAVSHARGEFVWLMTDDDLLKPGAIDRVLGALDDSIDLVVLNTEVRTVDFAAPISAALVAATEDVIYGPDDADELLAETANALSFIGCVVIRKAFWLARNRAAYYGSLFVHVGVIFQAVTPRTRVVAERCIVIRYGNAMWTPRGFEIWMFKWPSLIWSFDSVSDTAKSRVIAREPWRRLRKLWLYRSIGGFGTREYSQFLAGRPQSPLFRALARAIAALPGTVANALASLWCGVFARHARMNIYDLARSPNSTFIARATARLVGY